MTRLNPSISLATLARFAKQAAPVSPTQRYWGPQECVLYINRVTPDSAPQAIAEAFERLVETALHTDTGLMPVLELFRDRVAYGRADVTVDEVLTRCCGDWRQRLDS